MSSNHPKQKATIRSNTSTNGESPATPVKKNKRVSILDSASLLRSTSTPKPEFEELVYKNVNRRRSSASTGSKKVWFRDEKSSEDTTQVEGSNASLDLVQVSYFDAQMKDKEPWDDSNYYAGFMDLYTADEIWLWDISCCSCRVDSVFEIVNKGGKRIFYVETAPQTCMTLAKAFCLRPFNRARCGFVIQLFSLNFVKLVKYVRKGFIFSKELDIVEAFYGRNETYMGRIEKTKHGFLIRDSEDEDIYRVISKRGSDGHDIQSGDSNKNCVEMRIFRSDSHEVVGRLLYQKKCCLSTTFCSLCSPHPQFGIRFLPNIGTNAKILMIGTLLFQLYCKEDFLDLPLGKTTPKCESVATLSHRSLSSELFFSAENIQTLDLQFHIEDHISK